MKTTLIFSLLCICSYQSASAVVTTFTDRASWQLAVDNAGLGLVTATEDFNSTPVGTFFHTTPLVSSSGFNVSHSGTGNGINNDIAVQDIFSGSSFDIDGTNQITSDDRLGGNLTFTITSTSAVHAFAFDYSSYGGAGSTEGLTSNLGDILVPIAQATFTPAFFGFLDTAPTGSYTSFSATGTDIGFGLDNVSIATAAVPEPSSSMLLGLGALGLITRRSRRS